MTYIQTKAKHFPDTGITGNKTKTNMKKLFLTIAIAAASVLAANAQFFVGGTIGGGFNINSKNYDGHDLETTSEGGLSVGLKFGYSFTDKISVGLKGGINYGSGTLNNKITDVKTTDDILGWYVTPYFRYGFLNGDKFQFGIQADLNINGAVYSGDSYTEDLSLVGVGINVKPFVAYNITNNLSVDAELNILGLGFNYQTNANDDVYPEKYENVDFGLNINSNAAAQTMNLITVGVSYKF